MLSNRIFPEVTSYNPIIKDVSVDFPQPEFPTNATDSPFNIFKFKLFKI